MNVIVTAGGEIQPGQPLYEITAVGEIDDQYLRQSRWSNGCWMR
jgi:hypothetical protein